MARLIRATVLDPSILISPLRFASPTALLPEVVVPTPLPPELDEELQPLTANTANPASATPIPARVKERFMVFSKIRLMLPKSPGQSMERERANDDEKMKIA